MPATGAGTGIVNRTVGYHKFIIDGREATISADIPKEVEGIEKKDLIFTNPADMLKSTNDVLPSLSLIRFAKVKNFIDGVYAAVEEKVAETGHKLSRDDFLSKLESILSGDARKYVFMARQSQVKAFGEPEIDVVQGFYDWNEKLRQAYRQIKTTSMPAGFFKRKEGDSFNKAVMIEILRAMMPYDEIKSRYDALTGLYSKTTDKLDDVPSLFPPALLPDQKLFMDLALETRSNIPGGLGKALVKAVKSGRVDYTPKEDSGLYTRQMFEIVPLVLRDNPEFKKFLLNERYEKLMDEEFISQWVGTRDTHVAHTHFGERLYTCSIPQQEPIKITPELAVEPFSTCYDRMAESLHFFEKVIVDYFGEKFLDGGRVLNNGERSKKPMGEEFEEMNLLLKGLEMLAKDSIHQPYEEDNSGNVARKAAKSWLSGLKQDSDLNRNVAIFVPIIREDNGRQIAYINAGYKTLKVKVEYKHNPMIKGDGEFAYSTFGSREYSLPVLVHREIRIPYQKLINTGKLRKMLPERFTESDLDGILRGLD